MYGKNISQDYFDHIYNGNVKDEQDAYELEIWARANGIDLDME